LSTTINSSALTIGIDIGGTKVLGGVVDKTGKIIDSARRPTPSAGGKELVATIIDLVKEFQAKHEIAGIGISVAALISKDQGTIVGAPNIANLSQLNFVSEIKKVFNLPVIAENDANAAMWAEYKFGNAQGLNPVYGCIEQYASGSALMRYAKEAIASNPAKGQELLELCGVELSNLTGSALTEAAKKGNEMALAAFNKQADWLGSACASYTLLLDPQAIVVGGGVVEAGELFLKPVRSAMEKYMPFAGTHLLPKIIAAKFGNDAGLIGAADLVRD